MLETDHLLDMMLRVAQQQDPSIEPKAGKIILRACLDQLAEAPSATVPDLARDTLARYPTADPSWVAHLARAAITTFTTQRISGQR